MNVSRTLMLVIFCVSLTSNAPLTRAQGTDPDVDGHCAANSKTVLACWNPQAGRYLGESLANYSEFLPDLRGWDFRINLPHTRFQKLRSGAGTPTTMVGVIEDDEPLYQASDPTRFVDYGHRSNAIWLFRQEANSVYFSALPSRRDRTSALTQNVESLQGNWHMVGGGAPPGFQSYRVAAATLGRGIGKTTVHVIAVDNQWRLRHNRRVVSDAQTNTWTNPWKNLGQLTASDPELIGVGDDALALTWVDRKQGLRFRTFDAVTNAWSPSMIVVASVDRFRPRLVWDGTAFNLFFVKNARLYHAFLAQGATAFSTPTIVSSFLAVFEGQFDVMLFNGGLHAAVRTQTGDPVNSSVFYINTKSPLGGAAVWTIPSETELKAGGAPRIGTLGENVFVVAPNLAGRVAYARKDPNSVDNRITGGAFSDRWLEPGWLADPFIRDSQPFSGVELFSFNSDLYLTANKKAGWVDGSAQIINFGRAAMKRVLQNKWGMNLMYGDGAQVFDRTPFGNTDEIRMTGDFNGDKRTDVIRFTQKSEDGVGPAPVYVRRVVGTPISAEDFSGDELWHRFFSLKEEIPMVGDFNGDGRSDIITFVQKEQRYADGTVIGPAPVWVATSNGGSFNASSIWHKFFSLKGEIPLVGDFDGDGKTDIVTFVQKAQHYANGTLIGPAPVWVALSNGTSFNASRIWHTYFSLKGEVPMVGDFNGDGKDDIATFVQKPQFDANGQLIGHAPVWVSLSNGSSFGPSSIWHTYFSAAGELPRVFDVNMDGKDDIITFLHGAGQGVQARNVYVAYSNGARFRTSEMFASDQAGAGDVPYFGTFSGKSLSAITGQTSDDNRLLPDLYIFQQSGPLGVAFAMGRIPFQTGAPWERYRWFADKALGAAQFPEWIYATGPNHCLTSPFKFLLGGLGGSGGAETMVSSVRTGARQAHILQEMGHALFANCMRENKDPFTLFNLIYATSMDDGGLDANNMPGCDGFDDCRDPEHFFLGLMVKYRLNGDEFRAKINSATDPMEKDRRLKQYQWFKTHWYKGAEFKRGTQSDVSVTIDGVLCLPGECAIQ